MHALNRHMHMNFSKITTPKWVFDGRGEKKREREGLGGRFSPMRKWQKTRRGFDEEVEFFG